jgi:predicted RNA binding protein YcfA (HicA-like mRNA interferase family)
VTKLPRDVSGTQLISALSKLRWYMDHQVGSHATLRHAEKPGKKLVVSVHGQRSLKPGLLHRILRDAELSIEDVKDLL